MNKNIYKTFDGGGRLSGLCLELLIEQKKSWHDLREGYESLKHIRKRNLLCKGFSARVQYNPGRIRSSMANVDKKIVKERRCFLCLDNLPEKEKGILYRNEYLILCNPMPVFYSHFTVSHLDHCDQTIVENINTFLHLMADFGSGWTVLYNGSKCGASAPDHLHFQTAPSGQMPIEKEIREKKRLTLMTQVGGVSLYRTRDLGREVIILDGDDPIAIEKAFKDCLNVFKHVLITNDEPMINIAGFHEEKKWRLVIFPRKKHRPDIFFMEGEARFVISPGVIDMGGLLITPLEKDFERLDETTIEGIYREVSLGGETVERVITLFCKNKGV